MDERLKKISDWRAEGEFNNKSYRSEFIKYFSAWPKGDYSLAAC